MAGRGPWQEKQLDGMVKENSRLARPFERIRARSGATAELSKVKSTTEVFRAT